MLVSIADFRRALGGRKLTEGQESEALRILSSRQQDLENHLNRPVEAVLVRQNVIADNTGFVIFKVTPIWQILSMEVVTAEYVNAQMPVYTPPVLSRPTGYPTDMRVVDTIGTPFTGWKIVPGGVRTWYPYAPFLITYVGGYKGYVDDSIKNAIITVAKREYLRFFDHGVGEQGGSPQASNQADPRPIGWTDEELKQFDRIRRRVAV